MIENFKDWHCLERIHTQSKKICHELELFIDEESRLDYVYVRIHGQQYLREKIIKHEKSFNNSNNAKTKKQLRKKIDILLSKIIDDIYMC